MTKILLQRKDIDGLRAIAVLFVILFHYKIGPASRGLIGVDVFFVISGYLITAQLLSLVETQCVSTFLSSFYGRRIRRIFPALLTVLAASLVAGFFLLIPSELEALANSAIYSSIGLANVFFFLHTGYFDRKAELQPLLHMWSLGVEEQFYFFWPALLFVLTRVMGSRRRVFLCLAAVTASGLAYAQLTEQADPKAAFFLPLPRAWELSAGALLAFCPPIGSRMISELAGWTGIALLALSLIYFGTGEDRLGIEMVPVILGAGLLVAQRRSDTVARLLSMQPLPWIGLLSFGLYLWHWPVLVFFRLVNAEKYPTGSETAALLGLTTLLSLASYAMIETPVRRRNFTFTAYVTVPALGAVIIASLIMVVSGGLDMRLTASARTLSDSARDFSPRRPKCHRSETLDLPLERSCLFGAQQSGPEIAMWSDSHGVELAHALGEILLQEKRGAVLGLTYSACPPAQDFTSLFQKGCTEFGKDAAAYLVLHPEIHTVILATYFELYDQAGLWPQLSDGFERSVKILAASGKHVVLIASNPELGPSIPQAAARQAMLTATPRLEVPIGQHRAYSHKASAFLNYLQKSYPNVTLFDPADVLCDAKACPMIVDGRAVLFDADHLTLTAARRVARRLVAELPEMQE